MPDRGRALVLLGQERLFQERRRLEINGLDAGVASVHRSDRVGDLAQLRAKDIVIGVVVPQPAAVADPDGVDGAIRSRGWD